jgi:hypothetical protein
LKKSIIILFVVQLFTIQLFNCGILGELMKIPAFIEHFIEHNTQREMSLAEFISGHYSSGKPIDADHHEDMKLPFKDIHFTQFSVIAVISSIQGITNHYEFPSPKNIGFFYNSGEIISFNGTIWLPPKLG